MRYLKLDDEILLNQFIQKICPLEIVNKWFDTKSCEEKRKIVLDVLDMTVQSHPTYDEILYVVEELNVSKTPAAVKILNRNKPFYKFGHELANLPENELHGVFILLLKILSVADKRRKCTCCANGCQHWWHRDLAKASVLTEIKNEYTKSQKKP